MQINLTITQRRLILQGLWKEQDMYSKMLEDTEDSVITHHCVNNINAIIDLEKQLLGVLK